ncbi:hypothetical protein CRUP_016904 [Coryphaenoides rupestris]|nr:hypothetical protein CRUP_016904 [Coryphaenoides rupestris]
MTQGSLTNTKGTDVSYTFINCRLEDHLLRRFCGAAGYGWDYPDSEYRDVPLCVPEVLCLRLLLMVLTSADFALNPAGGAEVDIRMSAMSRCGHLVWESTLTLLSRERFHKTLRTTPTEHDTDWPDRPNLKRVAIRVPWSIGLRFAWSFSDYSPVPLLLAVPARLLLGYRGQCSPSLWMLSVCLAEIEKYRGVDAVTPPVKLTVRFLEPLPVPGQAVITFWETAPEDGGRNLHFQMEQHANSVTLLDGFLCRT